MLVQGILVLVMKAGFIDEDNELVAFLFGYILVWLWLWVYWLDLQCLAVVGWDGALILLLLLRLDCTLPCVFLLPCKDFPGFLCRFTDMKTGLTQWIVQLVIAIVCLLNAFLLQ